MFALTISLALGLALRAIAVCPVVTTAPGKYAGTPLPNGVTQWLGIRYAAPPVGDLRFRAPKDPESFSGVRAADKVQPGCPGMTNMPPGTAEDCLFLDVYAPTSAKSDSKLPVLVWIQGGGFASAATHTNGSVLISNSNMSLVTVSMTYRAGSLGFLAGKEIQDGGDFNNGLRDQRQVLKWVKDNIGRFGGDPDHVTVGGQSAGAGSVLQHLVASKGENQGLFHAAIMESPSLPPTRPFEAQQYQYNGLVNRTGCADKDDTLACLRAVPVEELLKQTINEPFPEAAGGPPVFPYQPVIDGDFVTGVPVKSVSDGKMVKVPILLGHVADEGAIFAPHGLRDQKGTTNFIKNNYPALSTEHMDQYGEKYAFDPAKPAPKDPITDFDTQFWRRASLAYGETRYACPTAYMAGLFGTPTWGYEYAGPDTNQKKANAAGATHGAELEAVWGVANIDRPRADLKTLGPQIQGYWASFVRFHDPNPGRAPGAPQWDKWTGRNRMELTILGGGAGMANLTDAQADRCEWLRSIAIDTML